MTFERLQNEWGRRLTRKTDKERSRGWKVLVRLSGQEYWESRDFSAK